MNRQRLERDRAREALFERHYEEVELELAKAILDGVEDPAALVLDLRDERAQAIADAVYAAEDLAPRGPGRRTALEPVVTLGLSWAQARRLLAASSSPAAAGLLGAVAPAAVPVVVVARGGYSVLALLPERL
jgi:hypothetical protein